DGTHGDIYSYRNSYASAPSTAEKRRPGPARRLEGRPGPCWNQRLTFRVPDVTFMAPSIITMTLECWRPVEQLYHAALAHDADARAAILAEACAGDKGQLS